jgi:hypothetical protein
MTPTKALSPEAEQAVRNAQVQFNSSGATLVEIFTDLALTVEQAAMRRAAQREVCCNLQDCRVHNPDEQASNGGDREG